MSDTVSLPLLDDPPATPEDVLVPGTDAPAAAPVIQRVVFIDPTAPDGGDGTEAAPFDTWWDVTFEPGTLYVQRAGTVASGFVVSGQGTADAPILIGTYGVGVARIEGTVVIEGAAHVTLAGFDITGGEGFGVHILGNSSNLTVLDNTVREGLAGIYLEGDSIEAVYLIGNRVHDNDTNGIWVNGAVASADSLALIAGNEVFRNGENGIALHGSHVVVDGNTVVNNGVAGLPGSTGIHVFGVTEGDGTGWSNVISNNLVAYQHDPDSFDGHGIQLDHYSGGNVVTGNRVIGNDGPGITLYSSRDNYVAANYLEGNAADPSGTREGTVTAAGIFIGNAGFAPGSATGNVVTGNTILTGEGGYAIAVTRGAEAGANLVGGNTVALSPGAAGFAWGGEGNLDLAAWNQRSADGQDDALGAVGEPPPALDPAMLAEGYTARSGYFATPVPDGPNRLVATAATPDLAGGSGVDRLAGDAGANLLEGLGATDYLAGAAGDDTLDGQDGDDMLGGGLGDDLLLGGTGEDLLAGGEGNDTLRGQDGHDWLSGGDGADLLAGGAGFDMLRGGAGADTFLLVPGEGADQIEDFSPGEDLIDLRAFGFASLAEVIIVGDATATLVALGGDDMLLLQGIAPASLGAADFLLT